MFRRLILLVLLCVALPGCTIWKERPPKTFSDVTGGENLERVFWQEVKAQHWNEVEKRLASNYIFVMPTGQLDRAATLNHLKQLQLQEYSLGEGIPKDLVEAYVWLDLAAAGYAAAEKDNEDRISNVSVNCSMSPV